MLRPKDLHDRVHIGLKPLLRRLKTINIAVHRRFRAQVRSLMASPQRERVPPTNALPTQAISISIPTQPPILETNSRDRPIAFTLKRQQPNKRIQAPLRSVPLVLTLAPRAHPPIPIHRRHTFHRSVHRLLRVQRIEESDERPARLRQVPHSTQGHRRGAPERQGHYSTKKRKPGTEGRKPKTEHAREGWN